MKKKEIQKMVNCLEDYKRKKALHEIVDFWYDFAKNLCNMWVNFQIKEKEGGLIKTNNVNESKEGIIKVKNAKEIAQGEDKNEKNIVNINVDGFGDLIKQIGRLE